jgi:hypothetical protein
MRARMIATVVVVALPLVARSECVLHPLADYVANERVAAILQVRVGHVERVRPGVGFGQIVQVEVQRLWKGETSREAVLYNLFDPSGREVEGYVALQRGETYFVVARSLKETEMREFNLRGPRLATAPCQTWEVGFARTILRDAPVILRNRQIK